MKLNISRTFIAVLALMCSSVSFAASVTVVPSTATATVGDTFTILVQGTAFPETAGATLGMTWNTAVVDVVSVEAAAGTPFTGGVVAADPWSPITILGPLVGTLPSGDFDTFLITFSAIGAGSADIVMVDDQSDLCWSDAVTFGCVIPVDYTQASVVVSAAAGPDIGVTDSIAPIDDHDMTFGGVTVFTTATETVTVTNNGTTNLAVSSVTAPATSQFSITGDTCSAQSILPAASCTITVQFAPDAEQAFTDGLAILSDDPDSASVAVALSGTGAPVAVPNVVITDSVAPASDQTVAFGGVQVGQTGSQTVTVSNDGTGNLAISPVTAPATAQFSITADTCSSQSILPAGSCTITVQFAPDAEQDFTDTLTVVSDDPDTGSVPVALSGTGTAVALPDITVTDSVAPADDLAVGFGTVNVSATGTATVTVTNDGTAALTIGTVQDPASAQFSITANTCTAPVAPAGTCTITLQFAPDAEQPFSDSLAIPSDDPDEASVTVALAGNGFIPLVPNIVVTDSVAPAADLQVAFGSVTVGQSGTQTVTIANDGSAALTLGQITATAPYTLANDTCSNSTVAIAANCTLDVQFQPVTAVISNGMVDIPSDDPDTATVTVNLTGTGSAVAVTDISVSDSVSPATDLAVPFGNVNEGQTSTETVTVTNAGNAALDIGTVVAPSAPFSITADTCSGQSVAAAGTCTITVAFAPDASGDFDDTLAIPSNDPDEASVTVDLSGSGVTGGGGVRSGDGGSSLDPATLLGLGLLGYAVKRRRRAGA